MESVIAVAITAFALSSIYIATITLQKSFRAAQQYAVTQAAQLRVIDYVALDLRRGVDWNATSDSGKELTVWLPNYYDNSNPDRPVPRDPKVGPNREVYYGSSPNDRIQVRYYATERIDSHGARVNDVHRAVTYGGQTEDTVLVTGAEAFEPVYDQDDTKRQVVYTKITFPPAFRPFINSGNAYRDGTSTFATTMVRNKR
jgi:hypothetical protein